MFPAQGTDAADLLPAQLLLVEASGGTLRLETDQGSVGFGKTLGEAMDDLQAGAKGQVFFGTVEHVVAAQSAAYLLPQLAASNELRPAAKLYLAPVLPEAADAVEFLAAHPGNLTLQRTRAALLYGRAAGGSAAADDGRRASPCRIDQPRGSAMHGCWLQ